MEVRCCECVQMMNQTLDAHVGAALNTEIGGFSTILGLPYSLSVALPSDTVLRWCGVARLDMGSER